MRFISQLISTMAGLAVAAWLFNGIWFEGVNGPFADEVADKVIPVALVALIMGVVGAVVTPVVKFLSLPFVILTLGLFLFVVNAAMLLFSAWIADGLGIGFEVDGFWNALGGALVITLVQRLFASVFVEE